jgi:hypothetical protein
MQKVYLRKSKTVADFPKEDNERILHFSLQDSLPMGHTLALNTAFGTVAYLVNEGNIPRLVRQEQFTNTEMSVLMPLLELFPYYCPYEVLYASFYGSGKVTDSNVARARQRLQEAQEAGIWDQEMRPVRCALSRTRLKMRSFGVDISSILATGYILMVATEPEDDETAVGMGARRIHSFA